MSAILFGSISSLVDTSDLQRAAFNTAFAEHGLDWNWERADYQQMLVRNGGRQRIEDYAAARGEQVDAAAIHKTKTERFQESLAKVAQLPRPGVIQTLQAARESGWKTALVTTTSAGNVDALLTAVDGYLDRNDFDLVVDSSDVDKMKPEAAAFEYALRELDEQPGACVAIEDNVGGVSAAAGAGVPCVVFANENTTGHDFGDTPRVAHLDFAELAQLVSAS